MDGLSSLTEYQIIPAFRFESGHLADLASAYGEQFRGNAPFPHVVIPNFLPENIARRLAAEFPGINAIDWKVEGPGMAKHTADKQIEKVSSSHEAQFPPLTRHVMHEFNSSTFCDFLETLTGYVDLSPDPSFRGCGLHSTGRGGRLMVHADSSRHPNPEMHQIINMIYYVTPNWQEEWGGHLELWDEQASQCVERVSPQFNAMLVFFTGRRSFHGHPQPLTTPAGVRRNSLAAYYYTTGRATGKDYAGHTDWVKWVPTVEDDRKISLSTRLREMKFTKALYAFARELRR